MIVVVGETIVDFVPEARRKGEVLRYAARPGGSPANTAVGLARLGTGCAFVGRISRSALGSVIREHLLADGVDLSLSVEADEPQSLAICEVGEHGETSYEFRIDGTADWCWNDAELPADLGDSASALHAGSLAAALAPGRDAVARLLRRERPRRLVSFDPNLRASLVTDAAAERARLESILAGVDLVKASDADCSLAYPGLGLEAVAERWLGLGVALVVFTRGAEGCVAFGAGEPLERPAHHVEVLDTVGAGDAFSSGLLHGIAARRLEEALRAGSVGREALGAVLDLAGASAALTCTREGANPPSAAELAAFVSSH